MASKELLAACKADDDDEVRRLLVLEGISSGSSLPPASSGTKSGSWLSGWTKPTLPSGARDPLTAAVEAGSAKVINVLLERGASVNNNDSGRPPLLSAVAGFVRRAGLARQLGRDDISQLDRTLVLDVRGIALRAQGCTQAELMEFETKGETLEKEAVSKLVPIIEKLLAAGALIDGTGIDMEEGDVFDDEYTALHIAARSGLAEVVEFLLTRNASWQLKTGRRGLTPIELAAMHGHARTLLVFFRIKPDETNALLPHLLKVACRHGRTRVALLILTEATQRGETDPDLPGAISVHLKHFRGEIAAAFTFLLVAFKPKGKAALLPPAVAARIVERAIVEDADQETMGCFCRLALQHALDSREALTGGDAALTATAPKAQAVHTPAPTAPSAESPVVPVAASRTADPVPAEAEAAADGKQDPVPAEADDKQAPPVDASPSASADEAAAAGDAAEAKQAGKGGSRGKKR